MHHNKLMVTLSSPMQASEVLAGTEAPAGAMQPNVWVAHLRDGIEAVELGSGRTVCKLHLATPGLHVDLDGDGMLDHIQASGTLLKHLCGDDMFKLGLFVSTWDGNGMIDHAHA